jgi:hypothetical protein
MSYRSSSITPYLKPSIHIIMQSHVSERDCAQHTTVVDLNKINATYGGIPASITPKIETACNLSSTAAPTESGEASNDQSDVCPSISVINLEVLVPMLTYKSRKTNVASRKTIQIHSATPLRLWSLMNSILVKEDAMSKLCSIVGLTNPFTMDRMYHVVVRNIIWTIRTRSQNTREKKSRPEWRRLIYSIMV